jgi:cysteine desulfurase
MKTPERIYLDHNATTPLHGRVVETMTRVLRDCPGNPSSTHAEGAQARAIVAQARERVATCLGASPGQVVFTGGATEANNTVLLALLEAARTGAPRRRLVTSTVEHPSVVAPAERLEKAGVPVSWVPVDADGRVDPEALLDTVGDDAALVSLIWANNETGVVQPVEALAGPLAERGVPLHVDATQAVGKWPVDVSALPIAFLSCSAHKLNGPKGVGCLYAADPGRVSPLLLGGPQERRLRGGTENVAGIAGFGEACAIARDELGERMGRAAALRDRLWARLVETVPGVRRNGSAEHVLPNTLSVELPGVESDVLVEALDLEGVAASAGAACHSGSVSPSHVLLAMGRTVEQARATLRLSVGQGNDAAQIDRAAGVVGRLVARAHGEEPA